MSAINSTDEELAHMIYMHTGGTALEAGKKQVGVLQGDLQHQVAFRTIESTQRATTVLVARNSFQNTGRSQQAEYLPLSIGSAVQISSQVQKTTVQTYQGVDPALVQTFRAPSLPIRITGASLRALNTTLYPAVWASDKVADGIFWGAKELGQSVTVLTKAACQTAALAPTCLVAKSRLDEAKAAIVGSEKWTTLVHSADRVGQAVAYIEAQGIPVGDTLRSAAAVTTIALPLMRAARPITRAGETMDRRRLLTDKVAARVAANGRAGLEVMQAIRPQPLLSRAEAEAILQGKPIQQQFLKKDVLRMHSEAPLNRQKLIEGLYPEYAREFAASLYSPRKQVRTSHKDVPAGAKRRFRPDQSLAKVLPKEQTEALAQLRGKLLADSTKSNTIVTTTKELPLDLSSTRRITAARLAENFTDPQLPTSKSLAFLVVDKPNRYDVLVGNIQASNWESVRFYKERAVSEGFWGKEARSILPVIEARTALEGESSYYVIAKGKWPILTSLQEEGQFDKILGIRKIKQGSNKSYVIWLRK